jgi:hypothetical protein
VATSPLEDPGETTARDRSDFAGGESGTNAATVVLAALGRFDEPLAELRKAADRPYAVFPIHYHENFEAALPHLQVFKGLSSILALRAVAQLADGKPELALQDVRLGFRLAEALKSEPLVISQMVRLGMIRAILQPVWEGMAQRQRSRWTGTKRMNRAHRPSDAPCPIAKATGSGATEP